MRAVGVVRRLAAATRGRVALVALAVSLSSLASVAQAAASPGSLDPGFGDGGRAIGAKEVLPNGTTAYWEALEVRTAVAPDGSLYTLDAGWVRHYLADGSLDTSFGSGGALRPTDPEGMPFEAAAIAADPAGRVLVFGTSSGPLTFVGPYPGGNVGARYATVLRYTADGQPDASLGGDGSVLYQFVEQGLAKAEDGIYATRGSVDPQGRIVFVVGKQELVPRFPRSALVVNARWVARLDESGQLDPSFGGGIVPLPGFLPPPWSETTVTDLVFAPGESAPEIAETELSQTELSSELKIKVKRVRADGTADTSFRVNRKLIPANAVFRQTPGVLIARDGSGRTVMAGSTDARRGREYTTVSVVRLLRNGQRDRRFGSNAEVELRLRGRYEFKRVLVAQGRILLVAETFGRPAKLTPRIAIIRLLGSGKVDRGFGNNGIVTTRFGNPAAAVRPTDAAVAPGNRLVVAGAAIWPEISPSGAPALFRYRLGSPTRVHDSHGR
jgi:uncharacterized delta-60 repeat protein